jgi:hypothetical protein
MQKNIEEPVTIESNDRMSDSVTTHPAYAQIGASRCSGNANLYDSDFSHQNFIAIRICKSEKHRSLNRDWHFGREELIEVMLSEAQWATFVSTPNVGSGVPCTINHIRGEYIPALPSSIDTRSLFKTEMKEMMKEIQSDIRNVSKELDGALGKKKVDELRKTLDMITSRITNSTGFVADQFDEHIENTVEKAKIEVNAYVTNLVQRTGLDMLHGGSAPILLTYDNDTE